MDITTGDSERDFSGFRLGQTFTYENCRFIADRDPYGRLLVSGFVDQSLRRFELCDPKEPDKPLDNSDDVWKVLKKQWMNFTKGIKYGRTFGESFTCIFKSENPKMKGAPFLKIFESKDVDETTKEFYNDQSLKKIHFWETKHKSGEEFTHKMDSPAKINLVWHEINEGKEDFWDGRSYLEPCWDEIQGIRAIRMGDILFAIRLGAGLRIITVPKGTHPDVISEMKSAGKRMDSFNSFWIIPEEGAKVDIETGQGQINYEALKIVLLQSIAAYTGYPLAGFQGLEMERQGGEFNEEKQQDVWRVLQQKAEAQLRWVITRFSDFYGWGYDDDSDYIIKWVGREEISDMAQAQLDSLVATKDASLIMSGVLSPEEVRDRMGLKGPVPERPNMFNVGVSSSGEDSTDENEEDAVEDDKDEEKPNV